MEHGQDDQQQDDADRDHGALPVARVLENALARADPPRLKHLLQERVAVDDLLSGVGVGAAVRTDLRRGVDLVMTGCAGDLFHH